MIEKISHVGEIVLPIFLIIAIGNAIVRAKIVTSSIAGNLSKLAFYLALPSLIFLKLSKPDIFIGANWFHLLTANAVVIGFCAFVFILATLFKVSAFKKGVVVQGTFRSNMAYMGLPICLNAFGDEYFQKAVLFLAFVMPVYNILTVFVLKIAQHDSFDFQTLKKCLRSILKNPLIIAVCAGFLFSILKIKVPNILARTLEPIGKAALPMALISVGCSLNFNHILIRLRNSAFISLFKLVLFPAFAYAVFRIVGISLIDAAVGTIMLSTPTAIASFVMTKEMGGDENLAADVVMVTTLVSVVTISGWLYFLL